MALICPIPSTSDSQAVSAVAATMSPTMAAAQFYLFISSTNCYILQGAAPTATAADGSMFVPAGVLLTLDGTAGAKLSVIRSTADGIASLTRAKVV
jgi:hypothetical protein